MKWLKELNQAKQAGRTSFLVSGAVNDVFPNERVKTSRSPLSTVPEVIMTAVANNEDTLALAFDPSDGFVFPNDDAFKKFVELAIGDQQQQGNPGEMDELISESSRDNQQIQLPTRPGPALDLIRQGLQAACETDGAPRLTIIFPDIDTYVQSGPQGAGANEQIALQLYRLGASERFRTNGHTVILTSTSVSALPDRLHCQDSPFCAISIWRPDQEERRGFVARITCSDQSIRKVKDELNALKAERAVWRVELDKKTSAEITEAEGRIKELEAGFETALLKATRRERQTLEAAKKAWTKSRRKAQIAKLESEMKAARAEAEELTTQLKECRNRPCTPENWATLQEGDFASLAAGKPPQKVLSIGEDGFIVFSRTNDLSKPAVSSLNGSEVCCGLSETDGKHYLIYRNMASGNEATGAQADDATIIPAAMFDLQAKLAEATALAEGIGNQIETLTKGYAEALKKAKKALAKAEKAADARHSEKVTEHKIVLYSLQTKLAAGHPDVRFEHDERIDQLEALLAGQPMALDDGLAERLSANMNGFSYRDVRDFIEACSRQPEIEPADLLKQERLQILRRNYSEYLELEEPEFDSTYLAGLHEPAAREMKDVARAINDGEYWRIPQGCMLAGPPGTGKTFLGQVLAASCGWLVVKPKEVRSPWLGSSEKRGEQQEQAIRNMQPVIVIRDEVDRTDTHRDSPQGDSGTSGRINAMWMNLLNDPKLQGKVLVLSMTNRPDKIDPAMLRAGRTDNIIPVLPPSDQTRRELFPALIRQLNKPRDDDGRDLNLVCDMTDDDLDRLVRATKWFTPADIKLMIRKAAIRCGRREGEVTRITAADLLARSKMVIMRNRQEMARWSLTAIKACNDMDLLPDNYEQLIRELAEMAGGRQAAAADAPRTEGDERRSVVILGVPVPDSDGGKSNMN